MKLEFESKLLFFHFKLWPFSISFGSNLKSDDFEILWFIIKNKFHPHDLYNFDTSFIKYALPRLKHARKKGYYKYSIDDDVFDKIIYAFEESLTEKDYKAIQSNYHLTDERRTGLLKNRDNKVREGFKLFGTNIRRLWF